MKLECEWKGEKKKKTNESLMNLKAKHLSSKVLKSHSSSKSGKKRRRNDSKDEKTSNVLSFHICVKKKKEEVNMWIKPQHGIPQHERKLAENVTSVKTSNLCVSDLLILAVFFCTIT